MNKGKELRAVLGVVTQDCFQHTRYGPVVRTRQPTVLQIKHVRHVSKPQLLCRVLVPLAQLSKQPIGALEVAVDVLADKLGLR